jgi:methyl-accepting chemotaxis protein
VKEATSAMAEINQASGKIADIISVIDAIAFQTNLLALNAAVEAARAGEQGKGFAVVAGEVRNLAGRSANAAKEIKKLINDSVDKVETGTELVEKSGKTLLDIVTQVENVSAIVSEISTGAEQQSMGISEVHSSLESLQMLTQQNTAMVEEAAAGSEELGSQARSMGELIRFFSIK